jgi:hypothetical protein
MARRLLQSYLPGHEGEVQQALANADANFQELYRASNDSPQGRLTLTTGVPIMTASVAGATKVIYTPYYGQNCPIFDGSAQFSMVDVGGELSQLTTDATKSPAAVAATSVYDMFVWNDGGTIRCTRGPAWTNTTTRGLALARIGGILVNGAAITNGPGIYQGTYVGTIGSNASSTIDWILGTGASGGGAAVLNVWNAYNRRQIITRVTDTQAPYTYTSATIRQAGGSASNQITYTLGLGEDAPWFTYQTIGSTAAAAAASMQTSIGDDSITAFEIPGAYNYTDTAAVSTGTMNCTYAKGMAEPLIGIHYAAALEKSDGTNANTFNVSSLAELAGIIWM